MSWSVPPVWYTLQAFGFDSSVFGPWLDGWYGLLSDTAALSILATFAVGTGTTLRDSHRRAIS